MKVATRILLALAVFSLALVPVFIGPAENAGSASVSKPKVIAPVKHGVSRPVIASAPAAAPMAMDVGIRQVPRGIPPKGELGNGRAPLTAVQESSVQTYFGTGSMPDPIMDFPGVGNIYGYIPPDTVGDVGPDHYVQWVNVSFAIFNKATGEMTGGPYDGNSLWAGFGGACETTNDGDPIVLYDQLADRWFMSQFALPYYPAGPFYQCIAVSKSGDPSGDWNLYEYSFPVMNDYPKFGVWPDGYYMSINQFAAGSGSWAGAGVAVFDRAKMIAGDSDAVMVYFDLYSSSSGYGSLLPSDLDGPAPVEGTPNYFMQVYDGNTPDEMFIWEFRVDWANPESSTFGLSNHPNYELAVDSYSELSCDDGDMYCIPQKDTSAKVDSLSDRLMFRLQYRNFGSYGTLVTNHTVDAGDGRAGVRWYEVRIPDGGTPVIHQQGTYAPNDGGYRWMGSAAMDVNGNIALGYSHSSPYDYPSIRYTGRLASDPLGEMGMDEAILKAGEGSQTSSSGRWGDYSSMSVDPVDDCTFWYTQEYYETTSSGWWSTHVGAFRFPGCGETPVTGSIEGNVVDSATQEPIEGAMVSMGTKSTLTDSEGNYQFTSVTPGTYTVTVELCGYNSKSQQVVVTAAQTSTVDFSLDPLATNQVCGTVTDSDRGWGIYAKIQVQSASCPVKTIYTDRVTGQYCIDLVEGESYTLTVSAVNGGYIAQEIIFDPENPDFELKVDEEECTAAGYSREILDTLTFKGAFPPLNWNVEDFADSGLIWYPDIDNRTMGTGICAAIRSTDICGDPGLTIDTALISPSVTLPAGSGAVLVYESYFQDDNATTPGQAVARLEISTDNGANWTTLTEWATPKGATTETVDLASFVSPTQDQVIQLRWRYSDSSTTCTRMWQIDNVVIFGNKCLMKVGGIVTGNVFDGNTLNGLNHAIVEDETGRQVKTVPVSDDPAVGDGYYALFLPTGSNALDASWGGGYGISTDYIEDLQNNSVVPMDFYLPAALVSTYPEVIEVSVIAGSTIDAELSLVNTGELDATYWIAEIPKAAPEPEALQKSKMVVKPFRQHFVSAKGLKLPKTAVAPQVQGAGEVIQSWTSEDPVWGVAYDSRSDGTVWLGSPSSSWGGKNTAYEHTASGEKTMRSHPFIWEPANGPADMAYNWHTGNLWIMNVASDVKANCIYEISPESGYTGNRICPNQDGFTVSQRGLAYDPDTDTFFAGGWNDGMIYRFKSNGSILQAVYVNIAIAGLAYNPTTQHLFVVPSQDATVFYVLDAANSFELIGQFQVEGFTAYGGAGLEIDCDGNLWAVDQNTETVYQVASGEQTGVCTTDVPWLSANPSEGSVDSGALETVKLTFDATTPESSKPGRYEARVVAPSSMPYPDQVVTVIMNVVQPMGSLKVNITPAGAVSAGAKWSLDGGDWRDSGDQDDNVTTGDHTVSFKDVGGWKTPASKTVTIVEGQLTTASGAYVSLTGKVKVTITPVGAVNDGAKWKLDQDGAWMDSGDVDDNVTEGTHTIFFKELNAWVPPAKKTVTVVAGQTKTVEGKYTPAMGNVQVTITPDTAVKKGAGWTLVSNDKSPLRKLAATTWYKSGQSVEVQVGSYTVKFKGITGGWKSPKSIDVEVSKGQTVKKSAKYIEPTGSLEVTINKQAAKDGAVWYLDGDKKTPHETGETIDGLALGTHTVSFKPIKGWITPDGFDVTIKADTVTKKSVEYVEPGSIQVSIEPEGAVDDGAEWTIDGGETWHASGKILKDLLPGKYKVEYKDGLAGWETPAAKTVTVKAGQKATAEGIYVAKLGSIKVVINPKAARDAGAKWKLSGTTKYYKSGETISNLKAGRYTVEFFAVKKWWTPDDISYKLSAGEDKTFTGTYEKK